jgi:hypothetical protein
MSNTSLSAQSLQYGIFLKIKAKVFSIAYRGSIPTLIPFWSHLPLVSFLHFTAVTWTFFLMLEYTRLFPPRGLGTSCSVCTACSLAFFKPCSNASSWGGGLSWPPYQKSPSYPHQSTAYPLHLLYFSPHTCHVTCVKYFTFCFAYRPSHSLECQLWQDKKFSSPP